MWLRVKAFLAELATNPRAAVRSAATSVLGIAGTLLTLAALVAQLGVELPVWWIQAVAIVTAVATALRTLIAAIDRKNTGFGRGA